MSKGLEKKKDFKSYVIVMTKRIRRYFDEKKNTCFNLQSLLKQRLLLLSPKSLKENVIV